MHTQIQQSNLKEGLDTVGRAVAKRPSLPVLSHVLLEAQDGAITLAGTDLETFIRCRVRGRTEGTGAYTVPYRLFGDLVKVLPDGVVDLQTDDQAVSVTCGRNKAHINGIDADEFPVWNKHLYDDGPIAVIEPYPLKTALESVAYGAATDESRPILTGVMFRFETGKVTFAAADGFRLAVRELRIEGLELDEPKAALVPVSAIEDLLRLLPSEGEPVEIRIDGDENDSRLIAFHIKGNPEENSIYDIELVSVLIQGNFVNYSQIVPKAHETRAVADRGVFETALRRAEIFARYEAHQVYLDLLPEESKIRLHAESAEMGEHNSEIDVRIEGEPLHIAFNIKFLRDAVASMPYDEFVIEFTDKTRPATVRPSVEDKALVAVVMPMHIREIEVKVERKEQTDGEEATTEA